MVAFVADLMDHSRVRAAFPEAEVGRRPDDASGADLVIVDLARFGALVGALRGVTRGRIVAFGPHVDGETLASAAAAGADVVLPRSRFFRDPVAAVTAE